VSKSRTSGRIMGITAALIVSALVTMFIGAAMGTGYRSNIEMEYPYDVAIAIDAKIDSFEEIIDFVGKRAEIDESVSYNLYEAEAYDFDIIGLSDYNRLRNMLSFKEISLDKDEYAVQCDTWYLWENIKKDIQEDSVLNINDHSLKGNTENIYTEPMEQYRMVGSNGYVIVVPDNAVQGLDTYKSRLAIKLIGDASQELRGELNRFVRKDWKADVGEQREGAITISISVRAWGIANSLCGFTTLSFCGFYLSAIFIIISGILLAFEQLERVANNRRLYDIIEKLGVDIKGRKMLIFKELSVFYMVPLIFPIVIFAIIVIRSQKLFGKYILSVNAIPISAGVTLLVFLVLYGIYFLTTYVLYKRCVLSE
jgi:hypothetical protein